MKTANVNALCKHSPIIVNKQLLPRRLASALAEKKFYGLSFPAFNVSLTMRSRLLNGKRLPRRTLSAALLLPRKKHLFYMITVMRQLAVDGINQQANGCRRMAMFFKRSCLCLGKERIE